MRFPDSNGTSHPQAFVEDKGENKMVKLVIRYGKKFEMQRIMFTLSKLKWYNAEGYKPKLPKISDSPSEEEIKKAIEKEFSEEDFQKAKKKLEIDWKQIKINFIKKTKEITGKSPPRIINVFLTKYGTGGSYYAPNKIIINSSYKNLIEVLKHEILHLLLEEEVKKRKFSQKDKEKFIDERMENLK